MKENTYIYPIHDQLLSREVKERLLNQKGKVLWMCGLSGSGKSTIAKLLEQELYKKGFITQVLDGDNVRDGINKGLGFSTEDRMENIRRVAEVSKLFLNCGVIVINCFVSPERVMRDAAQKVIGKNDFLEVYINAPIQKCEERDVKGLYKKARNGEIKNFTGIDAPFEHPLHPAIEIQTDKITVEESVKKLLHFLLPEIENTVIKE